MPLFAQVEIKQNCRDLHGDSEAFDLAVEEIKKSYLMFMKGMYGKSFKIQLSS